MFFDEEMYEYIAGIMYKVKNVEKINPPATATPIDIRLSAPAPVANTIGRIPSIVDKLVIRIGLNLEAAESLIAESLSSPASFL